MDSGFLFFIGVVVFGLVTILLVSVVSAAWGLLMTTRQEKRQDMLAESARLEAMRQDMADKAHEIQRAREEGNLQVTLQQSAESSTERIHIGSNQTAITMQRDALDSAGRQQLAQHAHDRWTVRKAHKHGLENRTVDQPHELEILKIKGATIVQREAVRLPMAFAALEQQAQEADVWEVLYDDFVAANDLIGKVVALNVAGNTDANAIETATQAAAMVTDLNLKLAGNRVKKAS